jgi:PAS domain S-box-containing protein
MTKKKTPSKKTDDLRKRSEERVRKTEESLSPEHSRRVLHELQTHQIVLEMQNEDLRRAQAELEASRARYFDLYDLAPVGYFSLNEKGLILEANLTAATLLGVARGDLAKQPLTRFILLEDQHIYYRHRKQRLETGAPQAYELRMVRVAATPFWALMEGIVAQDADGAPTIRVVISDITDRKRIEETLRESEKRYRTLVEHVGEGVGITDFEERFIFANPAAEAIFGVSHGGLLEHDLHEFITPERFDVILEQTRRRKLGETSIYEVEINRPDGEERELLVTAVPELDRQRQVVGTFGVFRDITERKRAEEKLRESEARYRTLVEHIGEGVGITDFEERFVFANPAGETIFGVPLGGLLGHDLHEFITPERFGVIREQTRRRKLGETSIYEVEISRADGEERELLVTAVPMLDRQGQVVGTFGVFRDITERKRAEEKLRESEALLNATQRLSKVGGWTWDVKKKNMFWTEETYRIHDFVPGEMAPGSPEHIDRSAACYDEKDRPVILGAFQRCAEQGEPYDLELPFTSAGGRGLRVRTTGQAVWEGGRIVKVVGYIMDISSQINEQTIRSTQEGVIVYGLDLQYQVWNPFMEQLSGMAAGEVVGKHPLELFPFLRESGVMERLEKALAGEASAAFEFPVHMPRPERSGWASEITTPLRNTKGDVIGVISVVRDITERKRAEDRIQELNQHIRSILESAAEGIFGLNLEGEITFVNPAAARMLGYAMEELAGRNGHEIWHAKYWDGSPYPVSDCPVMASLRDGAMHAGEGCFWRKDDAALAVRFSSTPIRQAEKITGAVVTFTDITQELELQKELARSRELEQLARLVAGLAHEVRNPLQSISAAAYAATQHETVDGEGRLLLGLITGQVDRISRLMNYLVELTKPIQTGSFREISLAQVLEDLEKQWSKHPLANKHPILYPDPRPTAVIRADESQLLQALTKLLENAAQQAPEGEWITLRAGCGDGKVILQIEDHGPGVFPDLMHRLFEPFFTLRKGGAGLGLTLVRNVVKSHGGSVTLANNDPGPGLTATVILPLSDAEKPAPA